MVFYTEPQHEEVNLARLVRRLEKSATNDEEWKDSEARQERIWLKAQTDLQKVKYARRLLKNAELESEEVPPIRLQFRNDTRVKLDKLESFLKDVQVRTAPTTKRPDPILPTIPIPAPEQVQEPEKSPSPPEIPEEVPSALPDDNLLSPPDVPITSPVPDLIPSYPSEKPRATGVSTSDTGANSRKHLMASQTLHEELSSQLEQMAAQLKRNTVHFSDSLSKDKSLIEEAQEKIENNFGFMLKERIRLRDHRGKSLSTTCLTVGIVVTVLLMFMLMVSVIRLT
ncbi:hypothetical protein BDQ17DRAFT_1235118 [Cyathus striatus]|nr:hypothetical protein BDQ17DRAFT_1235118 [Cyathus striatus]